MCYFTYSITIGQSETSSGGVDDFVRGEVRIRLMFKPHSTMSMDRGKLNVHIKEARDLPAMNASGLTNGMVKCFLLPDRSSSSKKKTGVVKNNLNPTWEERFEYQQEVSLQDLLKERVLEVTVWDHNKHGNDFIGGLHLGGAPGRAAHHRKWMDSIGAEVTHWEAMLSRPGEWVEEWHVLRSSVVPRDVDLSTLPLPFVMPSAKPGGSPVLPQGGTPNGSLPLPEHSLLPKPVASSSPTGNDTIPEKVHSPVAPVPTIQLEADIKPKSEPSSIVDTELGAESEPSRAIPTEEIHEDEEGPKSKQVTHVNV